MNRQRQKEAHKRFVSGHAAQASHTHEQVTSTKTADQESKEAAGQQ